MTDAIPGHPPFELSPPPPSTCLCTLCCHWGILDKQTQETPQSKTGPGGMPEEQLWASWAQPEESSWQPGQPGGGISAVLAGHLGSGLYLQEPTVPGEPA